MHPVTQIQSRGSNLSLPNPSIRLNPTLNQRASCPCELRLRECNGRLPALGRDRHPRSDDYTCELVPVDVELELELGLGAGAGAGCAVGGGSKLGGFQRPVCRLLVGDLPPSAAQCTKGHLSSK